MIATRTSGRSLSARFAPAAVDTVTPKEQVADEVRQRNEGEPPHPPLPVGPQLTELDHCEVEREGERDEKDDRRKEGIKSHVGILRDGPISRNRPRAWSESRG